MSISFEERKKTILGILNRHEQVRIVELVDVLGVSGETIRRDLDRLGKENLLKKVHGGAVREKGQVIEPPFEKKSMVNAEGKQFICKAAAELVENGDIIMIGHGTTPSHMVSFLHEKKDVTIVTPSIPILMMCLDHFDGRVIFTGGELGKDQKLTAGPIAEKMLGDLKADKAFIAAGGISAVSGVTDYDIYSANLSRIMMERADEVVILADHTKFDKTTFAHVSSLSEASIVVTDKKLSDYWCEKLNSLEIKMVVG